MTYITAKSRHQVAIPAPLQAEFLIAGGDILEGAIQNGAFVLKPKRLAELRRKSKVTSRSEEMVDLSLRLHHHRHQSINFDALATKM